ncbi:MAG: hypothetical protein ACRDRS_04455 [Pseudonocardiaceae bacterium]
MSSATAEWATELLGVPGTEPVRRALLTAVAELHSQAGDAALETLAMLYAGLASQRARTLPSILLATIHVRAGEPGGLRLAHDAITGVGRFSSGLASARVPVCGARSVARSSA